MKARILPYGDKNVCGRNIERIRKERGMKQIDLIRRMQLLGVDVNPSSLSKLESQRRIATDRELWAAAKIFQVPMEELITMPETEAVARE